jgi:L-aspartate oxidase
VGAGAAGLYAALTAAREGAQRRLISARPLAETASYWAQGGLAAALAPDDSPELHLEDTLAPAAGSSARSRRASSCDEAPARFRDLERLGVTFDADRDGHLALGLEGGHSRRRVAHAGGSATGRRILRELAPTSPSTRASTCSRTPARRAPLDPTAACAARLDDGARAPAPSCSPPAAPPRCGRAPPTRPARSAPACCSPARPAPRSPTSSSSSSTPPPSRGSKGREGFLATEALRGEGATLHDHTGERFVDELAPATRSPARSGGAWTPPTSRTSTSTCAASTPGASPTSSRPSATPAWTR